MSRIDFANKLKVALESGSAAASQESFFGRSQEEKIARQKKHISDIEAEIQRSKEEYAAGNHKHTKEDADKWFEEFHAELAKQQAKLKELEAGHASKESVDPDTQVATEDLSGKAKGFVGGVFATGAMNKKIEAKKAELHEIREKIKALKGNIHSAESYMSARESHQGEWTEALEGAYWDGVKKGYKGEKIEGAKWWQAKRTTVIDVAGKMNEELKQLTAAIAEAKTELAQLEDHHKGALHSAREEFAAELTQGLESFFSEEETPALEKQSEAAGAMAAGALAYFTPTLFSLPLLGASYGHLREEHEGLTQQIEAKRRALANAEKQLVAELEKAKAAYEKEGGKEAPATEGVLGIVGGAIGGFVLALARSMIPLPFLTTAIGTVYGAKITKIGNEMQDLATELSQLEKQLKAKEAEVMHIVQHGAPAKEDMASTEGVVSGTIGGAIAGSIPGVGLIHGAYRGHKIEQIHGQLKDVEEEITRTKHDISNITKESAAATEGLAGAAAGALAGAVPGIGTVTGAITGGAHNVMEEQLAQKKEELAKLKQRHIDLMRTARESLVESAAALETLVVSSEDLKGKIGGFALGVPFTAAQKNAIEKKGKKLEELKQRIAELKHATHSAEAFKTTLGEYDATATYSEEGYVKHYMDEWRDARDHLKIKNNGLANRMFAHKTIKEFTRRGDTYGDHIKELDAHIKEAQEEIKHLEGKHAGTLESMMEDFDGGNHAAIESFFSLESEAVIAAPAGGVETIVADEAPHRMEDHMHAADSCCDAMDSHLDEAGKLHRAVVQLESLMDVVRTEPNGLSQTDAKYVTLAVEHITADFAADVKLVPSIEAFGGPVSSQEATLTLEGNVKEVAAQIWAYLKELWAKFMAALKNMWGHLFGAAEGLARKAKGLEAKATAITGEPREASIDLGPLAHRVAIGGKVPASLNGILTFMKLGELKNIALKALDESEIAGAVQKMASGSDTADSAVDASMREALKTMPILNRELPGGVMYTMSEDGKVVREVTGATAGSTSIAVMPRVALVQLAHEAGVLATEAAGVLKSLAEATAKDAGSFLTSVNIEDQAKAAAVSKAVNVMVDERKRGLKLVADAITDYLKAAQALVEIGDKCAGKYGEAGVVEKAVDGAKAAAAGAGHMAFKAGDAVAKPFETANTVINATKSAVGSAVDSAKAGAAAVAAKVNPAPAAPAAAS